MKSLEKTSSKWLDNLNSFLNVSPLLLILYGRYLYNNGIESLLPLYITLGVLILLKVFYVVKSGEDYQKVFKTILINAFFACIFIWWMSTRYQ